MSLACEIRFLRDSSTTLPFSDSATTSKIEDNANNAGNNKINFLYFPPKPTTKVVPAAIPPTNLPLNGFEPNNNPNLPLPPFGVQTNVFMPPMHTVVQPEAPQMKIATGRIHNLTLKQLLNIIVLGCQPPIKYTITDYGVVFLPRDKDNLHTETRSFRLNGNMFRRLNKNK